MKKNNVAIGILAYDVEKYIDNVVIDMLSLNVPLIVINDASTDKTKSILENYKKNKNFHYLESKVNLGAGASTKMLLQKARDLGFKFLIKVDGDAQFKKKDVKKILDKYFQENYDFVKSNRFWDKGIEGDIPRQRFFGNLLATVFFQFSCGSNKLFDPLNGLFGVQTKILDFLDSKKYPNRYGYPFFISVTAVINKFKTYQINNTVIYDKQPSNLKAFKMLFLLIKLTIFFYFKKIFIKQKLGEYQRSALLDKIFIFQLLLTMFNLALLYSDIYYLDITILKTSTLLFLLIFNFVFGLILFFLSFSQENELRNNYIKNEIL